MGKKVKYCVQFANNSRSGDRTHDLALEELASNAYAMRPMTVCSIQDGGIILKQGKKN
jgi:hypothetical protein